MGVSSDVYSTDDPTGYQYTYELLLKVKRPSGQEDEIHTSEDASMEVRQSVTERLGAVLNDEEDIELVDITDNEEAKEGAICVKIDGCPVTGSFHQWATVNAENHTYRRICWNCHKRQRNLRAGKNKYPLWIED